MQELLTVDDDATNAQFVNPDPVAWIEQHFYIPETHGPIVLADYQKQALCEALTIADGDFVNSTIVWSDIKKSAKSTIAAAVALWRAWQVEWGQILIVANDLKQADSRVGYYLRRAIELHPTMRNVAKIRNYKVTLPNHTTIESIPIDPSGEAGSNADMIVFSELWGAHGKAAEQMWAEMTLSPTKFGQSFRWIETYAGYTDSSALLWSLYEQGVKPEQRTDPDLETFRNAMARLWVLWNTHPRLPWQSPEYYAQETAVLASMPSEFQRVHRNEWSEGGIDKFVPSIAWWDACIGDIPPLDRRMPLVVAVDGAKNDDHCAMVAVSRHPIRADVVMVRYVQTWKPVGQRHDLKAVENDLRAFCKAWPVSKIVYDPYQLHQMMTDIQSDHVATTEEFNQGPDRLVADKQLIDLIMEQRLMHDGNPLLTEYIQNAYRKLTDDRKLRIVKGPSGKKIDAAVALSMAAARLLDTPVSRPMTGASGGTRKPIGTLGGRW
jgi:phage terminase large subunit-like protein